MLVYLSLQRSRFSASRLEFIRLGRHLQIWVRVLKNWARVFGVWDLGSCILMQHPINARQEALKCHCKVLKLHTHSDGEIAQKPCIWIHKIFIFSHFDYFFLFSIWLNNFFIWCCIQFFFISIFFSVYIFISYLTMIVYI